MLLALLPAALGPGLALGLLTQIGIAFIICLSFQLLLAHGGMLSFGHAVYSGAGAYAVIHLLKAMAGGHGDWLAVTLLPLVGAVAGLALAAAFGALATRQSGTTFAMVTLGLGELMAAAALSLPAVFGGEGGVSANRVVGSGPMGISYGPPGQVYALVWAYALACLAVLRGFTRSPMGLLLRAVRDNPERAACLGHEPWRLRWLAFCVSGALAGTAGGLSAIHFELVSADSLGTARSATYLMFTVLGGSAHLAGAVLGAVLMVLGSHWLSLVTGAGMLYLGLAFLLVVRASPQGLAGWLLGVWQRWHHPEPPPDAPWGSDAAGPLPTGRAWLQTAGWLLALLLGVALIEWVYIWQFGASGSGR